MSKNRVLDNSSVCAVSGSTRETRQKRALRHILKEADRPLTQGEILSCAARSRLPLSPATIYRNLKVLIDQAQVIPVNFSGKQDHYELAEKSHHHHFHCRACDGVFNVYACPGDMKDMAPADFAVEEHRVTLIGLCPDCRSR